MKKEKTINSSYGLAAAGATLLFAAASGRAQAQGNFPPFVDNVYVGIDSGASLQQDIDVKDGFNGSGGQIKFQTGWTLGATMGYSISKYFSAELNSGVVWNNISTVGNQSLNGVGWARLAEVPVVVSGVFTYPLGDFKPYLGAGLGAAMGIFDSSGIPGSGTSPNPTYRDADVTFAYQVQLGFKYSLAKNLDLGLAYRFIGTSDHSWSDNSIQLNTSGTKTHLIEGTFTWRF
jgi:opacity protein-like surface antigen